MREKNRFEKHTEQSLKSLFSGFSHELKSTGSSLQRTAASRFLPPSTLNDEQWENILENLEYIHALLDDMSRYQNAGQLSLV